jgi:hypothetical protein
MGVAHPVQALAVEGMQVGLGCMGMQGEEASDGRSIPALGIQHHGLGAAELPAIGGGAEELTQLPEFSGGGATGRHGAGHGRAPEGEGQPSIIPRVM